MKLEDFVKKLGHEDKRPVQYFLKKVQVTHHQDREIRLLQAALKDRGTSLTYSQIIGMMIDDFLEKLGKTG